MKTNTQSAIPFIIVQEGRMSSQPNIFLTEGHEVNFGLKFKDAINLSGCVISDMNINEETFISEHRETKIVRFALIRFRRAGGIRRDEVMRFFKKSNLRAATLEELLVFVKVYREQINSDPHIALGSGTEMTRLIRYQKKLWWQRFMDSHIKKIPKIENMSPYVSEYNSLRLTGDSRCGFEQWEDIAQFLGVHTNDIFKTSLPEMEISQQEYFSLEQEIDGEEIVPIEHNGEFFRYRTKEGYICRALRKKPSLLVKKKYFRPVFIEKRNMVYKQ